MAQTLISLPLSFIAFPASPPLSIMVRAPWMGVDTGTNWYCSPGFNIAWTAVGYALGASFVAAVSSSYGASRSGMVKTHTTSS
jgi:hypothetical protein